MTVLTSNVEISKMREAGKIISEIFCLAEDWIKEGVSTEDLDRKVEKVIRASGAEPAFKGYRGFPASICASVNDVVVHGIPSERTVLAEGDIIGIDVGVKKNGYFADAARTFTVGKVSEEVQRLVDVTRNSLLAGIEQAIAGNHLYDISNAIQVVVQEAGFQEVRSFVGHGIGKKLHEEPEVPNFGEKGRGPKLKEGLALAVEPMVNAGTRELKVLADGWTAVTKDGKFSAHFEDTIIVGKEKAEIIT